MKRYIALMLVLIFIIAAVPAVLADEQQKTAGEKLAEIGIIQGYSDGTLHENAYITQIDCLVVLSRAFKYTRSVKRGNIVAMSNKLDLFINKAYHAYLIGKNKMLDAYYYLVSIFPGYEVIEGVRKGDPMFEDFLYLKRHGFQFPEEFVADAYVSPIEMLRWEMQVFGVGEQYERVVGGDALTEEETVKLLSIQHGLFQNGYAEKKALSRGDAFLIVLSAVEEK
ncbi:MAG: hypothetical protein DRI33_04780 [Caldiserica bacterium]|nr:MAG: hypothetical protein DRI33_04780 [Caldisericota bacterium]